MIARARNDHSVVIIEDDAILAPLMRYNLEACGYTVRLIPDGSSALGLLRQDPPDTVVLDWGLPGVAGIEVLRLMRLCPILRAVPVLMLTARSLPEDRSRAMRTGANAFMAKPFSMTELVGMVGSMAVASHR
jgi:two-component system phosphate regulon response regulator PhoB